MAETEPIVLRELPGIDLNRVELNRIDSSPIDSSVKQESHSNQSDIVND